MDIHLNLFLMKKIKEYLTNKKSGINLKPKANLAFILIFNFLKKIFLEVIFISLSGYVNFDENSTKIKECFMEIQNLSNLMKNLFGIRGVSADFEDLLNNDNEQIRTNLSKIAELYNQQLKLYKTQSKKLKDSQEREEELKYGYDLLMLDHRNLCYSFKHLSGRNKVFEEKLNAMKEKNKNMEIAIENSNKKQESLKKQLENEKKKNNNLRAKLKDSCDKQEILEKNIEEQKKGNSKQKLLLDKFLRDQGLFLSQFHKNNISELTEENKIMSDKIKELTQENGILKKQLEQFRNKETSNKTNLRKQNLSFRIKNAISKYQQGKNLEQAHIELIGLTKQDQDTF